MGFLLVIIVIGVAIYFISNAQTKPKDGKMSFVVEKSFPENFHLVKSGQKLDLWPRPYSNRVYIYANIPNEGLLAIAKSKDLHYSISNSDYAIIVVATFTDDDELAIIIHDKWSDNLFILGPCS